MAAAVAGVDGVYEYNTVGDMAVTVIVTPKNDGTFQAVIQPDPDKVNILAAIAAYQTAAQATPGVVDLKTLLDPTDPTKTKKFFPITVGGSSKSGKSKKARRTKGGKSKKARKGKSLRRK
jgi:hypothetical protein